jgi:hypothetical protein
MCTVLTRTVLTAGLLWAVPAAATKAPLRLVPAGDPALAVLSLVGAGPTQPVVLFDPESQASLPAARSIECFHRPRAPAAVVERMAAHAGHPCTAVADLLPVARAWWPGARTAIAAGAEDYPWLLQAAAFAGAAGIALLPLEGPPAAADATLAAWPLDTVYVTPSASAWRPRLAAAASRVVDITTAEALWRHLSAAGAPPPRAVVIANPADRTGLFSPSALSLVAPLLAAVHRAPLFLTDAAAAAAVERGTLAFLAALDLHPTHLVLVGDELALRSHVVPDPVLAAGGAEARGGGTTLRVELFSEIQHERPQDFAVGRLVAEDAAAASALLARQLHRASRGTKPAAFLVNADEIFPLGETIARTTIADLQNAGIATRAHHREAITTDTVRAALQEADVLVWEGHPRDLTLEERGGIAVDRVPSLIVLQGCYTLDRSDPFILIDKGTTAIVATSAAVYSAPGSGFARAFFDALVHEQADLGTALRNARNYLLALARLQRERQHPEWQKTYRAALAFALWGDPTRRAPLRPGAPAIAPAEWQLGDRRLALRIPATRLRPVSVGPYRAQAPPRAMYGGLLLRDEANGEARQLKELYFTVRSASPERSVACAPRDGWDVVSLFAPRTQTLTVLARPDWKRLARPPHGTFTFPLAAAQGACANDSAPGRAAGGAGS